MNKLCVIIAVFWTTSVYSQEVECDNLDTLLSLDFSVSSHKNDIPHSLIKALRNLTGSNFKIVNKKEGSRVGSDLQSPRKQKRRNLIFLAKSEGTYVLGYKHGGRGIHSHFIFLSQDGMNGDFKVICYLSVIFPEPRSIEELKEVIENGAYETNRLYSL